MDKFIMLLLVTSLFTLAGCAKTKFHLEQSGSGQVKQYDQMQHYFVEGIAQSKTIDAGRICGGADKVARVETQTTFVNVLLYNLTLGLYSPRQARVFCTL